MKQTIKNFSFLIAICLLPIIILLAMNRKSIKRQKHLKKATSKRGVRLNEQDSFNPLHKELRFNYLNHIQDFEKADHAVSAEKGIKQLEAIKLKNLKLNFNKDISRIQKHQQNDPNKIKDLQFIPDMSYNKDKKTIDSVSGNLHLGF